MKLRMVGCSHHHSNADVRDRLAFTPAEAERALAAWRGRAPAVEGVLLSTCNRVEFYAASASDQLPPCPGVMARHLAESHGAPVDRVRAHLETLSDEQAVEHLFRVASSLDSMVVGESQILAQVKEAYERAQRLEVAGPLTHGCFQAALRVAKRVAGETELHKHRVSIASVAITEFAGRIFERFDDKRVLVLGAGEMAEETLRYLADRGAREPRIANRSRDRAEKLAEEWGGAVVEWDERFDEIAEADMVVSATAADGAIVSAADYRKRVAPGRGERALFLLDLATPRDLDPRIGREPGVYLYSIDDLNEACQHNRAARLRELPRAERIVHDECQRFFIDTRHRASAPVIARLRNELEGPKREELERLFNKLPELDDRSRGEVARFADRLVNKILHPPMESLRDESRSRSPHGLLQALSRLFQLKD